MKEDYVLVVEWNNEESKGYKDHLFVDAFKGSREISEYTHVVLGPQGGRYHARCRVLISENVVDFDYTRFKDFNEKNDMYIGTMRLRFRDSSLDQVEPTVEWRDAGRGTFRREEALVEFQPIEPAQEYVWTKGAAKTAKRSVRVRPGQVRFCQELKILYGGACCITGCPIESALEAAHIDAFYGPKSDHPQNGLLLRADLHGLFDAGLLAIEPRTMKVHVAPAARTYPEYKEIHDEVYARLPEFGGETRRPSHAALLRRWNAFKANYPAR